VWITVPGHASLPRRLRGTALTCIVAALPIAGGAEAVHGYEMIGSRPHEQPPSDPATTTRLCLTVVIEAR
jgi:hypothetical protein